MSAIGHLGRKHGRKQILASVIRLRTADGLTTSGGSCTTLLRSRAARPSQGRPDLRRVVRTDPLARPVVSPDETQASAGPSAVQNPEHWFLGVTSPPPPASASACIAFATGDGFKDRGGRACSGRADFDDRPASLQTRSRAPYQPSRHVGSLQINRLRCPSGASCVMARACAPGSGARLSPRQSPWLTGHRHCGTRRLAHRLPGSCLRHRGRYDLALDHHTILKPSERHRLYVPAGRPRDRQPLAAQDQSDVAVNGFSRLIRLATILREPPSGP